MTTVTRVEQTSVKLGRQKVHDERSRSFPVRVEIDKASWRDKLIRVYDPLPNPAQKVGCCTGVAKCSQLNAVGNRVRGKVLGLDVAEAIYSGATHIDPWEGSWPPTDTGSSGLASAKVAKDMGLGGEYRWFFQGADEVVSAVMAGMVVSVGTWWYEDMFEIRNSLVRPTGARAGGHQWVVRGYDLYRDRVMGRCWWGDYRDFWISRSDLHELLMDDGDAHFQERS